MATMPPLIGVGPNQQRLNGRGLVYNPLSARLNGIKHRPARTMAVTMPMHRRTLPLGSWNYEDSE